MNYGMRFVTLYRRRIKTIPMEKKCKKAKWLSGEALQIAVKRRDTKSKGEKERYKHLNGLYTPWNSPGQNMGVGSPSLLQGIFPTQGLNPGLPHCRRILYQMSHKGSPRILEWVAYPFSSRSSQPRNHRRTIQKRSS